MVKKRMKKVVITGGIGSGKSFVCKIFECFGIPVFNSDFEANDSINFDENIKNQIKAAFGIDSYINEPICNGRHSSKEQINKKKLGTIIFNDKSELEKINNIVHPAVRKKFDEWTKLQNTPYVIQESAIIFESGQIDNYDVIITVSANKEIRIERAMKRDNTSRDKVLERINNQIDDVYKIEHSDFVINNNKNDIEESFLNLIPQVYEIHKQLIK